MKLTKAQRLFLACARTEYLTQRYKFTIACTRPHNWHQKKIELLRYETGELKRLRALRKRLIREALNAYETEKLVAQASAYERGFCAGRRIK